MRVKLVLILGSVANSITPPRLLHALCDLQRDDVTGLIEVDREHWGLRRTRGRRNLNGDRVPIPEDTRGWISIDTFWSCGVSRRTVRRNSTRRKRRDFHVLVGPVCEEHHTTFAV